MPRSPETRISREPSIIEIELLANVARIRTNAERAGVQAVIDIIDLYSPAEFLAQSGDAIDGIDQLTATIGHAFEITPTEQQGTVFAGYAKAHEYGESMGYAPKTEVETFCRNIEPLILAVSGCTVGS